MINVLRSVSQVFQKCFKIWKDLQRFKKIWQQKKLKKLKKFKKFKKVEKVEKVEKFQKKKCFSWGQVGGKLGASRVQVGVVWGCFHYLLMLSHYSIILTQWFLVFSKSYLK